MDADGAGLVCLANLVADLFPAVDVLWLLYNELSLQILSNCS